MLAFLTVALLILFFLGSSVAMVLVDAHRWWPRNWWPRKPKEKEM
jgi:hypothetical protein